MAVVEAESIIPAVGDLLYCRRQGGFEHSACASGNNELGGLAFLSASHATSNAVFAGGGGDAGIITMPRVRVVKMEAGL